MVKTLTFIGIGVVVIIVIIALMITAHMLSRPEKITNPATQKLLDDAARIFRITMAPDAGGEFDILTERTTSQITAWLDNYTKETASK